VIGFLVLVWTHGDDDSQARADRFRTHIAASKADWTCSLQTPGFAAFTSPAKQVGDEKEVLTSSSHAIFGHVFAKDAEDWRPARQIAAQELLASEGRLLIKRFWGKYVAFLYDERNRATHVVRDPSAGQPCYRLKIEKDLSLFFSDIEDVTALGLSYLTPDVTYLRLYLLANRMKIRPTGLEQISEVQPGECITIRNDSERRRWYWEPKDFLDDRIDDYDVAAGRLRSATFSCASSWSGTYGAFVHRLSGGFDSSVVLSALGQARPRPTVTCINRYTAAKEGDERSYARLVSERAGYALNEVQAYDRQIDYRKSFETAPLTTSPTPYLFFYDDIQMWNEWAERTGARAQSTGQGGDQVFFNDRSPWLGRDYFLDRGLHVNLFRAARDSARLSRQSVPAALAASFRSTPAKSIFGRLVHGSPFMTNEAAEEIEFPHHDWLTTLDRAPPGKVVQVLNLVSALNYYWPFRKAERFERIIPLLSQPVVELCLRIPTYVHNRGGVSRGLARAAFQRDIPDAITHRYTKGATTSGAVAQIKNPHTNRYFRELLLDGALVKLGLLDSKSLQTILSPARSLKSEEIGPLIACVTAEAWLQRWKSASPVQV
jgi:asparagine synthase (glutamine-hydrolysing)